MATTFDKQKYIEQEDQKLDALAGIVRQLKNNAANIGTEVDDHKQVIDDIRINVENTSDNIKQNTNTVKKLEKEEKKCCGPITICYVISAIQIGIIIIIALTFLQR